MNDPVLRAGVITVVSIISRITIFASAVHYSLSISGQDLHIDRRSVRKVGTDNVKALLTVTVGVDALRAAGG